MSARSTWSTAGAVCALLYAAVAAIAGPGSACRSAKLLRAGAYELCLVKAIARAERRGETSRNATRSSPPADPNGLFPCKCQ